MPLTREFKTLAAKLQEAATDLSHSDICKTLQDCLNDEFPGQYCYVADVFGDADSGDVVYCCGGQYYQASYEISTVDGKRATTIDTDEALNVLPRTVYDEEADEMDSYAAASEAERSENWVERFPGSAEWKHRPFVERFVSKSERDSMKPSDFAGTGKSFPINKPGDIKAAVSSIGRGVAGGQSASSIKSKIKSIAKRKGWTKYLPKAWQDDTDGGSADSSGTGSEAPRWKPEGVLLVEGAWFIEEPVLKEAATADYPIKLISPGRGTSGYYTESVLKTAADSKIFKAGTQMFWNHDTDAEEFSRPEGDLNRLAAVTTTDARWDESGVDGPGLYARAKVFSDYADKVKEKGPHIGLSIRAGGSREDAARGPDGKPGVITALKNALSVDFVTKAGRDGKVFTEAAIAEGDDMELKEVEALISSKLKEAIAPLEADNKRLKESLALTEAPAVIREALADIRLPNAAKQHILEKLVLSATVGEDGEIDKKKLKESVEAEAKVIARVLSESGLHVEVGTQMTEDELKKNDKAHAEQFEESLGQLADLFVGPKLVKGSVDETQRRLRKESRRAFREGRAA